MMSKSGEAASGLARTTDGRSFRKVYRPVFQHDQQKNATHRHATLPPQHRRMAVDFDLLSKFHPELIRGGMEEPVCSTTVSSAEAAVEALLGLSCPPRMVICMGLQGSGKSFFAEKLCRAGAEVSEASECASEASEGRCEWRRVCQDVLGSRQKCIAAARRHLRSGTGVVIDRTNVSVLQRSHWTRVAAEEGLGPDSVAFVLFDTPRDLCLRRARSRVGHKLRKSRGSLAGSLGKLWATGRLTQV
eukprot:scaffold305_cov247-Pinguiococcus_pyrenoidosus.AAC.7